MATGEGVANRLVATLRAAVQAGDEAAVDAALTPLVELAQNGHREALRIVIGHIKDQRVADRAARVLILNQSDVDEVVQQTLITLADRIDGYEHRGSFSGWVSVMAKNKAKQLIRAKKSGVNEVADTPGEGDGDLSVNRFSSVVAGDELRERALARLTTQQRQILELREVYGYSYDEIAEALDMPRNTVGTHLHRARARLVEFLLAFDPDAAGVEIP